MEDNSGKPNIDLSNLDSIHDIEIIRDAFRAVLEQPSLAEEEQSVEKVRETCEKECLLLKEKLKISARELEEGREKEQEASLKLLNVQKALAKAVDKVRSEEIEKNILAGRLKEWEHKAGLIEGARKGFESLMGQISEFKEQAFNAHEAMSRMQKEKNEAENKTRLAEMEKEAYASNIKEWEHKATEIEKAKEDFLSIIAKISGGAEAQEVMLRMSSAKIEAENKAHLAEIERESYALRLEEWECKAEDFKKMNKTLEEREKQCVISEKAVDERACRLEEEYLSKRKKLDEFKEEMRKEVDGLARGKTREEKTP
jgi:chromosome segregation ATPase